ncbi:MAG: cytochrome c biogenesis protein ResB [Pseudomonadota bacterium]
MTTATSGLEIQARSRWLRDTVELVSSMRFAIALLTLICIASVIGTVVQQSQPLNNYVNQFGPFWAGVFDAVGLYTVYSAKWFLLILGVLVLSTSLCIARNTPKILHDLKAYKEHVREQALQAFHHKGQGSTAETRDAALARLSGLLGQAGWKAKAQVREHGVMVAARKGMANKIGYLAAHSAIVLICLGGLFDGDLVVRAQMALLGKQVYTGDEFIRDIKAEHRLSPKNPTFRGTLLVPEGARAGTAVLAMPDGVVLQDLPFEVELKKFIVEYYDTGMPKLFASEIVIHDRETGQAIPATVKVNEPVFHRGIAIYQSDFSDGGSQVKLRAIPMNGASRSFEVEGTIGGKTTLSSGQQQLTLEFGNLRVINVENLGGGEATDVRKVDLTRTLQQHLGSGAKGDGQKHLRNVGPSISYRLRDAAGQAREFNNYMLPVELDGQRVFLAGVRDNVNDSFRYLRIPVDENDSLEGWARLRAALADPAQRAQAVRRYVAAATPPDKPEIGPQIQGTAQRVLALFAGEERARSPQAAPGGLQALSDFIEGNVPEADRPRISEVLLRILNGSLFELNNLAREQAGLKPLVPGDATQRFMTQAVVSLSDSFFYPAPVLMQLADFKQVQASGFQVARAPGKTLVYLGAVLLIVGVFAMLYVRERRLWIWLQEEAPGRTRLTLALSTTRRTLDADAEFEQLRKAVLQEAPR